MTAAAVPPPEPLPRPEPVPQAYAELCITTNFTFLKGASHPEELVLRAAELGLHAIAITDHNTLAGVVRAWTAYNTLRDELRAALPIRSATRIDSCSRQQIAGAALEHAPLPHLPKVITGARLCLRDSAVDWLALPMEKAAYHRLSQLLSLGKTRAVKGDCLLDESELIAAGRGMILIALPKDLQAEAAICAMQRRFPGCVFTGAVPRYDGSDQAWFDDCAKLALRSAAPMVALGEVLMHRAARRPLADVLTCIREGTTIAQIGRRALPNAEHRLKGAADMMRLFRHHPAAVRRTVEIADRISFDLSDLQYDYPSEAGEGEDAQTLLERLTWAGFAQRAAVKTAPQRAQLAQKLEAELGIIRELSYAPYFLTVRNIVAEARRRGILCQGRGSAGNSLICWALRITDVDPDGIGMVFARFVSRHRKEPPDIDVDFEHERREEMIQWIYETYGRERAGLCATVIHFRARAAIREVGKVMGLSQDVINALSGQIWGYSNAGPNTARLRELGLNLADPHLQLTLGLIQEIIGFPRHLSQHVGGFVITEGRLDALCPIGNAAMAGRSFIEWDKDDIDALKIMKVDVLSLGMLTCLRKAFDLLAQHERIEMSLASVPPDDKATYAMLQRADAVGVFQVESRAQMNFLPRMQPKEFYDLVIEVAIVRPGPIQGGMVKPYIRRRQGLEAAEPFGAALEEITRKTLGVPLFQEQAMQIAVVGAGYSPEEADRLRRSLASFRRMGTIGAHRDRFVKGMLQNGYSPEVAAQCFNQIEGFADYGFPESHAAAFALLTYVSSWLKCHHPAIFICALLNAQPMGFYAPAQLVRDAREHGVEIRPICVNHSNWDNHLERRSDGQLALRLGFRQIKGFRKPDAEAILSQRGNGYTDPQSLWLRAKIAPPVLEHLAEADAFAGMGLGRRDALWAVRAIRAVAPLPLFDDPFDGEGLHEPQVDLPMMHLGEQVVEDYVAMRLSLRAHPMELLRPRLGAILPHAALIAAPLRRHSICGLVITRQRPGTASGVIFLTLEDETGVANVVVWPKVYEAYRRAVMGGRLLRISGRLQREGIVTHLIAEQVEDLSQLLGELGHPLADRVLGETQPQADDAPRRLRSSGGWQAQVPEASIRQDFAASGGPNAPRIGKGASALHPRDQAKRLFPSRDFH